MNIQTFHSSSKGNLYRVSDGHTALLIDPGVPLWQTKRDLEFKLSGVQGCLCSHEHKDHSKGLKGLLLAGIDAYVSRFTKAALDLSGHRVHIIEAGKQFQVGTWTILPFDLPHDVPNLGFLLVSGSEKLVFATDCQYVSHLFRGITHIMIEANYALDILKANLKAGVLGIEAARRTIKNHMSLSTCIEFLKANDMAKVSEIWLLHLSSANSDAERFKTEIQKMTSRPTYTAKE